MTSRNEENTPHQFYLLRIHNLLRIKIITRLINQQLINYFKRNVNIKDLLKYKYRVGLILTIYQKIFVLKYVCFLDNILLT